METGHISRTTLTTGEVARLLDVDRKTIHNWVNKGHIEGWRTVGGHLRFLRVEVVRFMRRFGYRVPCPTAGEAPSVMLVGLPRHLERAKEEGLFGEYRIDIEPSFFEAVLRIASGEYEVVVLALDGQPVAWLGELVTALRKRTATRAIALLGLSYSGERRDAFMAQGGDAVAASVAEVPGLIRWATGAFEPSLELWACASSAPESPTTVSLGFE